MLIRQGNIILQQAERNEDSVNQQSKFIHM
jgi:hypothetical protein